MSSPIYFDNYKVNFKLNGTLLISMMNMNTLILYEKEIDNMDIYNILLLGFNKDKSVVITRELSDKILKLNVTIIAEFKNFSFELDEKYDMNELKNDFDNLKKELDIIKQKNIELELLCKTNQEKKDDTDEDNISYEKVHRIFIIHQLARIARDNELGKLHKIDAGHGWDREQQSKKIKHFDQNIIQIEENIKSLVNKLAETNF